MNDCLLCGANLQQQTQWSMLFQKFQRVICTRCHQQFEPIGETLSIQPDLDVYCLYRYNEKMIDYLHRYKFMHDVVLAKVFRTELNRTLRGHTVVPVPMHPQKLKERTFSHIDYLLQAAQISYIPLLTKTTLETQGTKTREERLQTTQFFAVNGEVFNKPYTLFDDIVTTGTTLKHAKQLLLQAGAREVHCIALIKA